MKQKLLLTLFIASFCGAVNAQKSSVYAITGTQKGSNNWTEVRLVDVTSGQELKTVFKNSEETQPLNARTGKPVVKKDLKPEALQMARFSTDMKPGYEVRVTPNVKTAPLPDNNDARAYTIIRDGKPLPLPDNNNSNVRVYKIERDMQSSRDAAGGSPTATTITRKIKDGTSEKIVIEINGQTVRINRDGNITTTKNLTDVKELQGKMQMVHVETRELQGKMQMIRTEVLMRAAPMDKPFSTLSAACAYDKKHERLYYTPLGIAQLRYIDLKSKTPQVFYFEDEQFGALKGRGDVSNQITRMVIGANGNGYALTNNAEHLIQFTTDKKAVITDLGSLTDDVSNGKYSVHNSGGYGGDIIAGKAGELYLITANHNIFEINIKNMTALYKGTIQGLPRGYSTNGAAVEEGSMVLVNSSNSTEGYYHFDMTTLAAEKVQNSGETFNASDLANANLLTFKKEKKEEQPVVAPVQEQVVDIAPVKNKPVEQIPETRLSVYPNPVTNSVVNLVLENYVAGKYQARLIDVSGKQLGSKGFTISNKSHTEPFNLPPTIAKGNYLIQLYDQSANGAGIVKLVVQ
jgi:hypothetical protein